MAEAVVDDLEAVEVHEQDGGQVVAVAAGALHGAAELVDEVGAVGQVGEGVVHGVVTQAFLGGLAGRDVGERAGDAHGAPALVALGQAEDHHPAVAAGAVEDAVLDLEALAGALQVGGQVGLDPVDVLGVDAAEPLAGGVADLAVLVADQGLPARRVVDAVAAQVPVPDAVVGAAHGEGVAAFALTQGGLGGFALGDIAAGAAEPAQRLGQRRAVQLEHHRAAVEVEEGDLEGGGRALQAALKVGGLAGVQQLGEALAHQLFGGVAEEGLHVGAGVGEAAVGAGLPHPVAGVLDQAAEALFPGAQHGHLAAGGLPEVEQGVVIAG